MHRRRRRRRWAGALAALALAAGGAAPAAGPPDLRVEWWVGGRGVTRAPPVRGAPGETVEVDYLLRNVGGAAAWAVLVSAATTLGPVGTPARLQPGPGAGEGVRRRLALALAEGQREVCVEARLQTLNADDPGDPEPADNRRCRAIVVAAGEEGGDGRRGQGAGAGGP